MTPSKKYPRRVWKADIFDAIHFATLALGGIGRYQYCLTYGQLYATLRIGNLPDKRDYPVCVVGYQEVLEIDVDMRQLPFISPKQNDEIVSSLITQGKFTKDKFGFERVTFLDYIKEGNIHREDI